MKLLASRLSVLHRSRLMAVRSYAQASLFKTEIGRIVGEEYVLSSPADMENYTSDWTKTYTGGSLVCFPKTTQEVSKLMAFCGEKHIGVVPQGGNTGLVGGGVGTEGKGELILSLKRMNQILEIDSSAGVVTCEAGCVLEWLNNEVGQQNFVVPLDLAAKGSCVIGGNVATNAGGLRVMKYGSLQGNVLGLEVVLADGTVLDMLRTLRKDNCGLHSKHLFIGSEGILGVITKVSILLATKPSFSCVVFAKLRSFRQVQPLLSTARRALGDTLTAFEFMDSNAIDAVRRAFPAILSNVQESVLPAALAGRHSSSSAEQSLSQAHEGVQGEVAVLLECTGTHTALDQQRVDAFAELIVEQDLVADAVLSLNSEQEKDLWKIRENLTVALAQLSRSGNPLHHDPSQAAPFACGHALTGRLFKYDLSVRLQDTALVLARLKQRVLQAGFRMKGVLDSNTASSNASSGVAALLSACELEFCNYGHIADQNIHLNILAAVRTAPAAQAAAQQQGVEEFTVPVPMAGEQRKYLKAVAPGTTAAYIHAYRTPQQTPVGAATSAGAGAVVSIDPRSLTEFTSLVRAELNRHIFDLVLEVNGSISAEHGVGAQKAAAMPWARSHAELRVMQAVKGALDPRGILNPGKVLPTQADVSQNV